MHEHRRARSCQSRPGLRYRLDKEHNCFDETKASRGSGDHGYQSAWDVDSDFGTCDGCKTSSGSVTLSFSSLQLVQNTKCARDGSAKYGMEDGALA